MWGKPESPKRTSSSISAGSSNSTYIAADAEFSGKLTLKGNARIDGKIQGQLVLNGDLIIGPSAIINANIKANSISVSGEVRGDVVAQDTLELCTSAKMKGNIFSKQLKIDQGAQFIGTSRLLDDAEQHLLTLEESSTPSNPGKEDSTVNMDDILKPLDPLEEEQEDSSEGSTSSNRNIAYGKGKSRRR